MIRKTGDRAHNIKKNYKTIIGVTLLAFLLWFMVKMSKVYEYDVDVPIHYINLNPDMTFVYPESTDVRIEFSGKGTDLLRLHFYSVYYQVDLSDAPRHMELDLSQHPEYVNYPAELDVRVKSIIRPRILAVDLDKKEEKKIPVKVNYQLETPPGYILVDTKAQPDSVLVTGPAVMFKKLDEIFTQQKEYKNAAQAFTRKIPVKRFSDYYARYEPSVVNVTFDIQRLAEKEIPNVPVTVINVPPTLQVVPLPSTATIYVKGGEKILADLEANDFKIVIDFRKEWSPGVKEVKADLITEANVLYMETRPPEFELIVQRKRTE